MCDLRGNEDRRPNDAGGDEQALPPNQPSRTERIESGGQHHAVSADQDQNHAARGENPVGEGHEALRVGDRARVSGAVGQDLPHPGDDDIAEKQHDPEDVNDFEGEIGHVFTLPRDLPQQARHKRPTPRGAQPPIRQLSKDRALSPRGPWNLT